MFHPNRPLLGLFLWIESLAIAGFVLNQGQGWLWPLLGVCALLAALLTRGLWLALVATVAAGVWWFTLGRGLSLSSESLPAGYAVVTLLLGIVCSFIGILDGLRLRGDRPLLSDRLSRSAIALHFVVAAVFLADSRILLAAPLVIGWAAAVVGSVLAVDTLATFGSLLYTAPDQKNAGRMPGAFFFFRWLGPQWRACLPGKIEREDEGLLKISEMWMWPVVGRALPLMVVIGALIAWAASCIHEVGAGQQGVRVRFGTFDAEPLSPGLHVSLPWPMGGVETVETGTLHQVVLGFSSDTGKPILWERPHYVGEELSLVGGGDDFLSISVPILYRISDPAAYLRSAAASDELLRNLARRSLLHLTLNRSAAEIMTTSREEMRAALHRNLQSELDQRHSGLVVCDVYFRDIHPPVAVAPAFQEVVSAIEEKEALIHGGEEYQLDRLPVAKGEARQVEVNARAAADDRLLKADGEVGRFGLLSRARAAAPALYDLREGYRNFDLTLAGAKKAIFDDRLRSQMPTHLDLRRVLNPKLIDTAPPPVEPLVPDPMRARENFNLNVEGFH